jgi:Transposase
MPDVAPWLHPGQVRRWVSFDQHKFSIVAAVLPPDGGKPEVWRIETTEKAIRRFVDKLGGPEGLAVCYEAGPGGFALWRLLTKLGVACDVVAPPLIPVRAGDRVKTDRRDAKKLVTLYRAGLLRFVHPPTAELEGLRDLLRARDDLGCADGGAQPGTQAAAMPRPDLPGGEDRLDEAASRLDRPPASRRSARPRGARAAADPLGRNRTAARHARRAPGRDRRQRTVVGPGADPDAVSWDLDADRTRTDRRDRRLRPLLAPARARLLARDHPQRVLLRRSAAPRAHHPVRQPSRPPAADRGWLALPSRSPPARAPARHPTSAPGRPRSGSITATATSPNTASAARSRTSRSRASWSGSCGPR